jgi:hypothetical protein
MAKMTTKQRLERLVLDVCEFSSSFCMDVPAERRALADAITVDVLGRFKVEEKPADEAESTLARVL